jgi:hypothetical protein
MRKLGYCLAIFLFGTNVHAQVALPAYQALNTSQAQIKAFDFVNPPSSGTLWTETSNGVKATIGGNPTYVTAYGGGFQMVSGSYIDINGINTKNSIFTLSMAVDGPSGDGGHYNVFFDGSKGDRLGDDYSIWANIWGGVLSAGTQNQSFNTGTFTTGIAWYDFVYNGNTVQIYKNATLIGSGTLASANMGWKDNLRIGQEYNQTGNYLNGKIHRIRYQKAALDQAGITTQYNNVKNTYSAPTFASFSFANSNASGNLPNNYISVNNLTLSQLPTAWTIQWTYKMDQSSASADGMHWFFRNPSTTGKYSTDMHLYQINGQLQFWYNGNTYAFTAAYQDYLMTGLTQGTTYKFALTYDGTAVKFYSNGILKSTFPMNITVKPTTSTMRMGSTIAQTIDEFRIWDSALSAAQITANQDVTVAGSAGLMLYYNFNNQGTPSATNTAITSLSDLSGNNRYGSFNNVSLTGSTSNFVTSIVTGF